MNDAFAIVVSIMLLMLLVSSAVMHAWDVAERRGRGEFDNHGDGI